ncbi:BglG family transcription antiterminator [Anaerostipes sp.]|uniref:BglG family transcription antiterminator n=1 Tax=Anaerostipes sp. TaxID=1872530 RepID=UPI0025BCC310|nr:BglG family transcription antiterminator [Anaerostipes sp.]
MNNRLKTIFLFLIQNDDQHVTVKDLSHRFSISMRTAYSDLNQIDDFLLENGFMSLTREKSKGVMLQLDSQAKRQLQKILWSGKDTNYSPRERSLQIIRYLLEGPDYITIDEISNHFQYSRNTIVNDLKKVKSWLDGHDLKLMTYPYKGICIEGRERSVRAAWTSCLTEDSGVKNLTNELRNLNKTKSEAEALKLIQTISDLEEELNTRLSDEAYGRIVLCLGFSVYRIRNGKEIEKTFLYPGLEESNEYQAVSDKGSEIEEAFGIQFSGNEKAYLASLFIASSLQDEKNFGKIVNQWLPLQIVVRKLIMAMEAELNAEFMSDQQLFYGLLAHLRPAYYRILCGMPTDNPMYEYVTENFSLIHESMMDRISIAEQDLGITFPEEEVSFLTICFAAALERQKKRKKRLPFVMVVCSTGTSTSQMLLSQLKSRFQISLLGAFPARKADEILQKQKVDLIISTVELIRDDVKIINVSPVLEKHDIERLSDVLSTIDTNISIDEILGIMKRHGSIQDEGGLKEELRQYFEPEMIDSIKTGKDRDPMLIEVLNEDLIETNAEIQTRDEAVRESGRLLCRQGFARESYVEAMIQNVKENGTYIVIAPGIAMPHARPECGAEKIGISLITLKEPVVFGHKVNDPVKIVIGLCAIDHQTHLTALSELVEILNDKEKIDMILKAVSPEEVMDVIKKGAALC